MTLFFASNGNFTKNNYFNPSGAPCSFGAAVDTIVDGNYIVVNRPGNIALLRVTGQANTSVAGETLVVYKNGVASTISAHAAAGTNLALDNTHVVACVAGDLISIFWTNGSQATWTSIIGSLEFQPT